MSVYSCTVCTGTQIGVEDHSCHPHTHNQSCFTEDYLRLQGKLAKL